MRYFAHINVVFFNMIFYVCLCIIYIDDAYIVYILNIIHVPVIQRKYLKYVFN